MHSCTLQRGNIQVLYARQKAIRPTVSLRPGFGMDAPDILTPYTYM